MDILLYVIIYFYKKFNIVFKHLNNQNYFKDSAMYH